MTYYVTYVIQSFNVHTLPWNMYCAYVIVYIAISECITRISKYQNRQTTNVYCKVLKLTITGCSFWKLVTSSCLTALLSFKNFVI